MKKPPLQTVVLLILLVLAGFGLRGFIKGRTAFSQRTSEPSARPVPRVRTGNPAPTAAASATNPASNSLFQTADSWWQQPIAEEPFARFHDWADSYAAAPLPEKAALEPEGINLSRQRRQALTSLIKSDPERALQLAVPIRVRKALPDSVSDQLEERISTRGRLSVLGALAEPGKEDQVEPTFRTASLDGREFKAFVYGRRLGEPTRDNIPLNGIALDDLLALNENPLRILEPEEASEAKARVPDPICAISGKPASVNNDEVAADLGGNPVFLCSHGHAVELNGSLTAAESGPPGIADGSIEASTWTEGQKALILIRVDFPDLAGVPFADATGITLISNLNVFYTEMSYGRTGFFTNGAGSDFTPTFRMPQSASWYGTNNYYDQLRADARTAAAAAGYTLANYTHDVICMGAVPGFNWSGLGYVGASGAWLRSSFTTGVAGHELGHNWGLNHANFWDTSSQSIIGPGTSVEYGDSFDTMGSASAGNNHFNARYKSYLNWLTANDTLTATSNGTYRIYAHDNQNSSGIRGLRIIKNPSTNYWVEFRQKFTSNKWLMNGAGLRWAQNGNERSQLLDTTPGSIDGKNDTPIVIGRTFSDTVTGIHITPIAKGGTTPESLDVVVNLGQFPANQPPVLAMAASATNAATGIALDFTATASDPDGDAVAYYWDFGDDNFGTNGPSANKSWSTAGDYVVRCVVSDMKGGVASESILVTIGTPTTYRISGAIVTTNGPLQGARVYVSTTRMAYSDSDGTYTITGLPAGTYTVNASLENYVFTNSDFINPIVVGPIATNADFFATYTVFTPPVITTQPLSTTVNPGTTANFSVVATGTTPLRYQWRFNGAGIANATGTSYTKTNVQAADAGNYSVVITNQAGTATSANAVLALNTPPSITSPPQSQTVVAGTNATFTVTAAGTAPLSYQWRFNGVNIVGATASSWTRANVQLADAGNYVIVVTNTVGAVTSAPAALTVNFALVATATAGGAVSKNPDQPSYPANTTVTLTASSTSAFTFAGWSGNAAGTNNPLMVVMTNNLGITANFTSPVPDLIIDNPAATFTGTWNTDTASADKYGADYRYVSTSANSASATAMFTPNIGTPGRYDVFVCYPTITKSTPSAQFALIDADGATTNSVNQTTGQGTWQLLGSARRFVQGTNGFVRLTNMGPGGKNVAADAVRWVYSADQSGMPPVITAQPASQAVLAGQTATFNVSATGTAPLVCQWRYNAAPLVGATNGALTILNAQVTNAGTYVVVITNLSGSTTSAPASLTIRTRPLIGSIGLLTNGNPTFTLVGTAGDQYTLEFSTNLIDWTAGATLTNLTGTVQFIDTGSTNFLQRYYRCRLLP